MHTYIEVVQSYLFISVVFQYEPLIYSTVMKKLVREKEKATALRKQGYTYNEILKLVPVAKSSLSLWLKDLPLTKNEKQALKHRKDKQIDAGRIKVAGILRTRRLEREKEQLALAKELFGAHTEKPLFFIGIALYWAEGGKRTDQWQFTNSDAQMQRVMIRWLTECIGIDIEDIRFRLYVHKSYLSEDCEAWWAKQLHVPRKNFLRTVVKPGVAKVKKRPGYKGCLRIEVRRSKGLLNQMRFWQKMLVEYC